VDKSQAVVINEKKGFFVRLFSFAQKKEAVPMRKLKRYRPTSFMAEGSYYDKAAADYAVLLLYIYKSPKRKKARKQRTS